MYYIVKWEDVKNFLNRAYEAEDMQSELLTMFFDQLDRCEDVDVISKSLPCYDEIKQMIQECNKKQIIAFIGRAGSGKDYQAQLLEKKGYTRIAFADALRDITAQIVRWPLDELLKIYDDFKKGDVFPGYTGREILENVGSAIRKYDPQFWVNAAQLTITQNGLKKVVISDMRYINEYFQMQQFCNQHGFEFKCIFCDYHSDRYQEVNNHESAWLSNFFAQNGYKDLQEINEDDIQLALRNYPED